jgi:adenosylcobinamide-phosphate synthase
MNIPISGTHISILYLALFLDQSIKDPPNRFHPVAWMGSLIAWARDRSPGRGPLKDLAFGAGISLAGGMGVGLIGAVLTWLLDRLPAPITWLGQALLLKSTFSLRGLNQASREVEVALADGDLPAARRLLAWHLVSRDTADLDASQVAAATIESIAENSSDGILAPFFYYALGGLPLALIYRYANTADSMLGYHTQALEWLGKIPARLDDLFNYLPARLTGLLIVLSASLCCGNAQQAWRALKCDARRTQSPNAGYPMSAMAGALDIELEKVGHYCLGRGGSKPGGSDIQRARRLMYITTTLAVAALTAITLHRQHAIGKP